MNINDGRALAESLFLQIVNKPVTRVLISYKACATLDFGKDLIMKSNAKRGDKQFARGEWVFWLYSCAWRLDQNNQSIIGSGDSPEAIKEKLSWLEGKKLLNVKILNAAFDLILSFENEMVLFVFSMETEDPEPWTLATPDNKVFVARSGNTWTYEEYSPAK